MHRKPGDVDWPNPNLDVAYSEAWVAVDEKSCLIVSVPKITGRYFTVQFLNGWGETVANLSPTKARSCSGLLSKSTPIIAAVCSLKYW